jgi:hypothetical protein
MSGAYTEDGALTRLREKPPISEWYLEASQQRETWKSRVLTCIVVDAIFNSIDALQKNFRHFRPCVFVVRVQ